MKYGISKMVAVAVMAVGVQAAQAGDFLSTVPVVHVAVPVVESQAQLADTLREQGFGEIALADAAPTFTAPHPELNPARIAHPEATPVRAGWNGTAVKDGQTVEVYADVR